MPYGGDVAAEDATNEEFGNEIGNIEAEDSASESLGDDEDEHQEDLGFEAGDEEDEALLSMELEIFPTTVAASWLEAKPSERQEKLREKLRAKLRKCKKYQILLPTRHC